ncbi:MAG: asparagine synthase C-terminal domain-containing protein, partial [Candidatus Heimdallarchaeota archaeon]
DLRWGFCSMVEPLITLGFEYHDIKTVPPGSYIITQIEKLPQSINWKKSPLHLEQYFSNGDKYNINELSLSYFNRINELTELLTNSVLKRIPNQKFSIFISGGIDSSILLSLLLKKISDKRINIICVGFPKSSDLEYSLKLAEFLNVEIKAIVLDKKQLLDSIPIVKQLLINRSKAIFNEEMVSPLDLSISIPLYFASKYANTLGDKVAFSGQGADELFIGYKKYYNPPFDNDKRKLIQFLNGDLANISKQNLERDDLISMHSSIELRFPYLDLDIIEWVKNQHLSLFFNNHELRKQILRDIAAKIGLPKFIVERKKKAAQYGSNVMRNLKKESKSFKSLSTYINTI